MSTSTTTAASDAVSNASLDWPRGFRASVGAAAIKKAHRDDLALLTMPSGATAAAIFTRNLFAAAPIEVSRRHLRDSKGHASALILNSGCANAATGPRGLASAVECVDLVSLALGCAAEAVLVNSTGVIGVQLPMERIAPEIPHMVARLSESADGGPLEPFARAIMTTDTKPKMSSRAVQCGDGRTVRVSGVAKGAGMIRPDMATMISVLATDAEVDARTLDRILRRAADASYHRISVDGDTSTNDSVFAFASGAAGPCDEQALAQAFREVACDLARMIVCDGEGFERSLRVRVTGAATKADALKVAETVASSLLVRTAITGGDPNWGRIVAAAGRAGVAFRPSDLRLTVGGIEIFADGQPLHADKDAVRAVFNGSHVDVELSLGATEGEAAETNSDEFLSCGLTTEYVRLNADYTT
ncbi:MAG: bifunctional glutamate N-acetyltransferase/amino-acid acetyltransferase ArgJ [Planctomycetaceae bacterium]|jgi:glutamate N-acetyltransferase/amino-acid N-acetyltransferase|nr:bifunctional glutamate N-acetyltransferase/amino-acid acetyltransferase ArgJ [Planctomycetaceae bacterium]